MDKNFLEALTHVLTLCTVLYLTQDNALNCTLVICLSILLSNKYKCKPDLIVQLNYHCTQKAIMWRHTVKLKLNKHVCTIIF